MVGVYMRSQMSRKVSFWIALLVLGCFVSVGGNSALAMIPTAGNAAVPAGSLPGGVTAAAKGVDHSLDNFDCSTVSKLGIDKMMNLRASAIMVHCGLRP